MISGFRQEPILNLFIMRRVRNDIIDFIRDKFSLADLPVVYVIYLIVLKRTPSDPPNASANNLGLGLERDQAHIVGRFISLTVFLA